MDRRKAKTAKTLKQNKWYVITGGPCSGKTTVVAEIEKKGFRVVYEAARILIDTELKKGRTLKEIRADELAFQKAVLQMKIDIEQALPQEEIIFFDRGMHDSEAYMNLFQATEDPVLQTALKNSFYQKVFLFEPVDFVQDYARTEDKKTIAKLNHLLRRSYVKRNIPVITVAKMPVEKRVEHILKYVNRLNSP